ncbi:MAG: hypothetical protein ACKVJK_11705 [Methylophagaceae bacterium]
MFTILSASPPPPGQQELLLPPIISISNVISYVPVSGNVNGKSGVSNGPHSWPVQ